MRLKQTQRLAQLHLSDRCYDCHRFRDTAWLKRNIDRSGLIDVDGIPLAQRFLKPLFREAVGTMVLKILIKSITILGVGGARLFDPV